MYCLLFYFTLNGTIDTKLSHRRFPSSRYSVAGTHFRAGRRIGLTIGDTAQTCRSYKLRDRHGTQSIFNLQFCHNGITCVSWKSGATLTLHRGSHSGNAMPLLAWSETLKTAWATSASLERCRGAR